MTGEISTEWIKHFDTQTRQRSNGNARLLLVDGHVTHYTRAFLEYAREHNIHVLCYPAHATHVYQGLDVALFGPLKTAFVQERDRWEREQHEKVSKANFLEIYGRAHVRVMTPDNIRAAFRASGSWPINPNVVTPQMLAPSRETSWQAHMPLSQPTPVRRIAELLRVSNSNQYGTAHAPPQCPIMAPSTPQRSPSPSYTFAIDPVLLAQSNPPTTPQAQISSTTSHTYNGVYVARSTNADIVSQDNEQANFDPSSPRTLLRSTSAGFLVDSRPLTADMHLPRNTVSLPDAWSVPKNMLTYQPVTHMEAELLAALHMAAGAHNAQRTSLLHAHATMVLQNTYCERVKGQLAASEKTAHRGKSKRLMGDGMPQLLTGEEFYQRVVDHNELAAQELVNRGRREQARAAYQAALENWTRSESYELSDANRPSPVLAPDGSVVVSVLVLAFFFVYDLKCRTKVFPGVLVIACEVFGSWFGRC